MRHNATLSGMHLIEHSERTLSSTQNARESKRHSGTLSDTQKAAVERKARVTPRVTPPNEATWEVSRRTEMRVKRCGPRKFLDQFPNLISFRFRHHKNRLLYRLFHPCGDCFVEQLHFYTIFYHRERALSSTQNARYRALRMNRGRGTGWAIQNGL